MAIAYVRKSPNTTAPYGVNAANSVALTITSPSVGNHLVATSHVWNSSLLSSATFGDNQGNSWGSSGSSDKFQAGSSSPGGAAIIGSCKVATSSGSHTVTMTPNLTNSDINFGVIEISGAKATGWVGNSARANGFSTAPATGSITISANALVVAVMSVENNPTITPNWTSATQVWEDETNTYMAGGTLYKTSASNESPAWTLDATRNWAAAGVAYLEEDAVPWEPQVNAPEKIINIATPRWRS